MQPLIAEKLKFICAAYTKQLIIKWFGSEKNAAILIWAIILPLCHQITPVTKWFGTKSNHVGRGMLTRSQIGTNNPLRRQYKGG